MAKTHLDNVSVTEILNTLVQVDAIDADLWRQKVIWVNKFSERLSPVFGKRGAETPQKPSFCDGNCDNGEFLSQPVTESTQSKVKESKGEESKEDTTPKPPKGIDTQKRCTKFVSPTVDEVTTYCTERKNVVDPQKFIDHYISNGWKVGKTPMKDWKAAVRTWEKSDKPRQSTEPDYSKSKDFFGE